MMFFLCWLYAGVCNVCAAVRGLRWQGGWLLLSLATAAFADTSPVNGPCPAGIGATVPQDAEALQTLARQLGVRESECLDNAAFLAWYGAILNALGQADAAATRLERSLMIEPESLAARVEYAVALGRSSRWAEAIDLADQLLAERTTPAALRVPLRSYRDYWATRLPGFWSSAQIQFGYSTNLNSGPRQSSHLFTFGGQDVAFDLAAGERPRSGSAVMVELAGGHEAQYGNSDQLYASGVLRLRHSEQYSQTDYVQADGALNWTGPLGTARFYRQLGLGVQLLQGRAAMATVRSGGTYEYIVHNCLVRGGADLEWRRYPDDATLDGIAPGLLIGARCETPGYRLLQPSLQLRLERDYARQDRPGGDQRKIELLLSLRHPLAGGSMETYLSQQWLLDQSGYSPLLENNSLRHLSKSQLKLEYRYPIDTGWLAVTGYNWARQDSNLSLFRTQEQSIWLGLRRQW